MCLFNKRLYMRVWVLLVLKIQQLQGNLAKVRGSACLLKFISLAYILSVIIVVWNIRYVASHVQTQRLYICTWFLWEDVYFNLKQFTYVFHLVRFWSLVKCLLHNFPLAVYCRSLLSSFHFWYLLIWVK